MLLSTKNVHKELVCQKAALLAEMAEIDRKEKEAVRREAEVACNAEAAWLGSKKGQEKREEVCSGGVGG